MTSTWGIFRRAGRALFLGTALFAVYAFAASASATAAGAPPQLERFVAKSQNVSVAEARQKLANLAKAQRVAARLRSELPPWFAGAWIDADTLTARIAITTEE